MKTDELKNRTKQFAIRVIKMTNALPPTQISKVITNQILRSSTSVGANYRAACRARSEKDFLSKITIVEEETDETLFWLELISELELLPLSKIENLMKEADELVAIFTASGKTMAQKLNKKTS